MTLKDRYIAIRFMEQAIKDAPAGTGEHVVEYLAEKKREVRKLSRRPGRRIFHATWDAFTEIVPLPEWISSREEAEEYIHDEIRIPYVYGPYDCTGQLFTYWTHAAYLGGRWVCYHRITADV